MLAELAGVDTIRIGIDDDLKPVREHDVEQARRAARRLELRMPPSPGLLKVALQAQPDRVLLSAGTREGRWAGGPLDLLRPEASLVPVLRSLDEAGLPVALRIPAHLESIKAAHGHGATAVELFTGSIVDLPARERRTELESLRDAVRLAAKLRLGIGLGGGLGFRSIPDVLAEAPAAEHIAVGRAALSRALLVGLDRALRDLLTQVQ